MRIFRITSKAGNFVLTLFNKEYKIKNFLDYVDGKNYALDSGERQTATTLDGIRIDHINRYNWAIDMINQYLSYRKILNGADIFCGNGYGSNLISNKVLNLNSLLSIDGSKGAIKLAKKHYKTGKIRFQQKLFPFKLKANFFDFIVSLESIEHIQNDYNFIDNFKQALKYDGILILSTPNAEKYSRESSYDDFHFRHYLFENIVLMMKSKGFELLRWGGQDTYILDEYKRHIALVNDDNMDIKPKYEGQFIVYVFKKLRKGEL